MKNTNLISIILPTYNESRNIINILKSIEKNLPDDAVTEVVIVDDNSPDGTRKTVENYICTNDLHYEINVINRIKKLGLSSAILEGIKLSHGNIIVVMDCDFSHPPHHIPKLVHAIKQLNCDLVVASRYIHESKIKNWSFKRKIMSKIATEMAKTFLRIQLADPLSGFFAFRRNIINNLKFNAIGYKILLEILVKTKNILIMESPYTFIDRKVGSSKLDFFTVIDYFIMIWKLYLIKNKQLLPIDFFLKITKFYIVGAVGLCFNYIISLLLTNVIGIWYLYANIIGIIFSIHSNFLLNKIWIFNTRQFSYKIVSQYAKFIGLSSITSMIQLLLVYCFVSQHIMTYSFALIVAIALSGFVNFVLNKKLTFNEKLLC